MELLAQPWWSYVTVSVGFFAVCLGLNYFVKKMNEARMGERLVRVLEKSSVTQRTHVNGPVITVPSEGEPRANIMIGTQAFSPPAISLVFDKEENKRIGDVYNMVKPITDWNYGDPSLNIDTKSLETVNILSISSDHTVGESSPIKNIECELVTADANSSHKFSEKVLIKDKIDSYDQITPKNSSERNPSDIPGIVGYNTNSVTAKEPGRIIIRGTLPSDTVAENNSFSNICAGRMPTNPYTVENTETTVERKESSCITAKESSYNHSNSAGENIPVKTSKSEQIVPKDTLFEPQNKSHVREYVSITNNVIMNSSSNERRHYDVTEFIPIKNTECGPVLAKASFMDKIDRSDLPDPVTVKNSFEQISGTLPFTRKDLYTSKLIFENESIISNTDILAAEKRADDPTNYVIANIPFKNIGAGRIFPTNISITEISVKGSKVIGDKKSNEEIDTSYLGSLKSKFNNNNDDTRIERSAILSNRNVTKISSVEKMESKEISPDTAFKRHTRECASIRNCVLIELKNTSSSERSSSNVSQCAPIKTSEPRRIVARQTALLTRSDTNVTVIGHALENAIATTSHTQSPIRTSEFGFLAAEDTSNRTSDANVLETHTATPSYTQSEFTINKDGSIKKTESRSKNVKETSNIQTEMNVPDKDIVKMDGPRRTALEEKSLRKLVLANNCIEVVTIITSGSGSIDVRETVSRSLSCPDVLNPIKMSQSGSIAGKESFRELVPANNATDFVIVKTNGSGSIDARETASLTLSRDVLNPNKIKMSQSSGSIVVKDPVRYK